MKQTRTLEAVIMLFIVLIFLTSCSSDPLPLSIPEVSAMAPEGKSETPTKEQKEEKAVKKEKTSTPDGDTFYIQSTPKPSLVPVKSVVPTKGAVIASQKPQNKTSTKDGSETRMEKITVGRFTVRLIDESKLVDIEDEALLPLLNAIGGENVVDITIHDAIIPYTGGSVGPSYAECNSITIGTKSGLIANDPSFIHTYFFLQIASHEFGEMANCRKNYKGDDGLFDDAWGNGNPSGNATIKMQDEANKEGKALYNLVGRVFVGNLPGSTNVPGW